MYVGCAVCVSVFVYLCIFTCSGCGTRELINIGREKTTFTRLWNCIVNKVLLVLPQPTLFCIFLCFLGVALFFLANTFFHILVSTCKSNNVSFTSLPEFFSFSVVASDSLLTAWKYESRRHTWAENLTLFNLHDLGNLLTQAMREMIWTVICSSETEKAFFSVKTLLLELCWMSEIIWTLAHELFLTTYINILDF